MSLCSEKITVALIHLTMSYFTEDSVTAIEKLPNKQ